jgi:flagellin
VRINSNLEALKAQRSLDRASELASRTMERLSSGMRINRASDDAAGLAVAMGLNKDSRVFDQGVRNLNDAISYLNIADGALTNLSDITGRLKELATQAANGSYSSTQRAALDDEAYRLTLEFNRLIEGTSFNGRMVIQGSNEQLNLQAGYSTLSIGIMDGLERKVGTGTFEARASFGGGPFTDRNAADLNGDGNMDIIGTTSLASGTIAFSLGNGDGTFRIQTGSPVSGYTGGITTAFADVNGDGRIDLVGANGGNTQIALGNGDGTFAATQSIAYSGTGNARVDVGDVNGDGFNDVSVLVADGTLTVYLSSASGALTKSQQIATSANGGPARFGDFNGDGRKDLSALNLSTGQIQTYLGIGNGTFQTSAITSAAAGGAGSYIVGDFDNNGIDEFAISLGAGSVAIFKGSQSGQASLAQTLTATFSAYLGYSDLDGDGIKDLTLGSTYHKGNRDGSFGNSTGLNGLNSNTLGFADFNNDSVLDAYGIQGSIGVWTGVTSRTTSQQYVRLGSETEARNALSVLDATLTRISSERGLTGSYLSRLQSSLNTLTSTRENYMASESRIRDVDVAFESANLLRASILQQSASAVMAQAGQSPRLALLLLQGL